jgi:hypothetical protein
MRSGWGLGKGWKREPGLRQGVGFPAVWLCDSFILQWSCCSSFHGTHVGAGSPKAWVTKVGTMVKTPKCIKIISKYYEYSGA